MRGGVLGRWIGLLVALTPAACSRRASIATEPAVTARPAAPPMEPAAPAPTASALEPAAASRRPARPTRLPGPAALVHEEDGNLVVTDAAGKVAELTHLGRDADPKLAPDGRHVAFARRRPGHDASSPRDLFLVGCDGTPPELLVEANPSRTIGSHEDDPPLIYPGLMGFFPDGQRIAFTVPNGRGDAIVSVDIATRKLTWVASAFGHEHLLVPSGPFAGDLVVYKHLYDPGPTGGTHDECWLVDGKTGKKKLDLSVDSRECDDSPALRRRLGWRPFQPPQK